MSGSIWTDDDRLRSAQHVLIEEMVKSVSAAVVNMHLRLVGIDAARCRKYQRSRVREVRAILATCAGREERREVVGKLRYFFRSERERARLDVRWQDYVRRVAAIRLDEVPAATLARMEATKPEVER